MIQVLYVNSDHFCGHDIDTKGVSKAMFERFDPKDIATFSETSFALLK